MRRYALLVTAVLLFAVPSLAETKRVHGFVTAVDSPTSFAIGGYKITRDSRKALEFEDYKSVPSVAVAAAAFKPEDIRIGTELEVEGDFNDVTKVLKATSAKVFLLDTVVVDRTAQLEKMPELQKNPTGAWNGLIFADGQCVVVTGSTAVSIAPELTEVQPAEIARVAQAKKPKKPTKPDPSAPQPFASLDQINADTFVHYESTVQPDGSINAVKVVFAKAGIEPSESKLWKGIKPKLKEQNYTPSHPGHVTLMRQEYKLFPSREVQDYVSDLGRSLIPHQQKNLQIGDPLKIDFRFYVIDDKFANCDGYPNGVVVIDSGVLAVLQNEAQLAFVLSNEIASTVEKATWRDLRYHATTIKVTTGASAVGMLVVPFGGGIGIYAASYALTNKALHDDYWQSLENQADRIALEIMLSRGYDIREAPKPGGR